MSDEQLDVVLDETESPRYYRERSVEAEVLNDEDVEIITHDGSEPQPYSSVNPFEETEVQEQEEEVSEEEEEQPEFYTEVLDAADTEDTEEFEDSGFTSLAKYSEEEEQFDLEQKVYDTYTILRHLSETGTAIGNQYCFMDYSGNGNITLYNRNDFPHNTAKCRICPSLPEELSFLGLEQASKLMTAHAVILRDTEEQTALHNNGFLDVLPQVPFIYIKSNGDVYFNFRTIEILREITYRDTVAQEVLSSMSKSAIFTFSSSDTIIYVAGSGLVQDVATVTPYNGEQLDMDGYTYYLMKNHLKACLQSRNNYFHTFSSLPIYEVGSLGLTIGGMETAQTKSKNILDLMLKK